MTLVISILLGDLPSDELLTELSRMVALPGLPYFTRDGIKIPKELRDAVFDVISPSATALSDAGVLPFLNEVVVSLEQIPKLIDEVRRIGILFIL
jgi:hypothetical protein